MNILVRVYLKGLFTVSSTGIRFTFNVYNLLDPFWPLHGRFYSEIDRLNRAVTATGWLPIRDTIKLTVEATKIQKMENV